MTLSNIEKKMGCTIQECINIINSHISKIKTENDDWKSPLAVLEFEEINYLMNYALAHGLT